MRSWGQALCTIILPTSVKEEPFSPFVEVGLVCETTVTRVEYFPIMISGGSEFTAHMPQHAQALRKQC